MKRRVVLMALGAAATWLSTARAQQQRVRRVGYLIPLSEGNALSLASKEAFLAQLQKVGWTEGRDVELVTRWTGPDIEKMRDAAREVVRLQPDLIIAPVTPMVLALQQETSLIPIVFVTVSDPIGSGIVRDLAHPGGNVTGFTSLEPSMAGKWLHSLREIVPSLKRAALLFNPATAPNVPPFMQAIESAASSLAIAFSRLPVSSVIEMESAMRALASEQDAGLMVMTDVFANDNRARLIALVAELRLPAIYPYRFFVADGGLISYGVDTVGLYAQAGRYAGRILRGEKAGDLPVQEPNKFELVINLKTARSLGLTIPATLLASADEVIE
jgi:putative ABC transport system substrate-binding protein